MLSGLIKGIDFMLLSMQGSSLSQGSIVCGNGGGGRCLSKYLQNFLFSNNLF